MPKKTHFKWKTNIFYAEERHKRVRIKCFQRNKFHGTWLLEYVVECLTHFPRASSASDSKVVQAGLESF